MEPFRHPVADRLVLTLVNTHAMEGDDFHAGGEGHGVFLSPKAMKRYFEEYERWMLARAEGRTPFREKLRHEVGETRRGAAAWGGLRGVAVRRKRGHVQYVICYDIADDLRRSRVASALLDFGARIQESVFMAHLDDVLAGRMRERLTRLVDADRDRVHVFEACGACEKRVWTLGTGQLARDPGMVRDLTGLWAVGLTFAAGWRIGASGGESGVWCHWSGRREEGWGPAFGASALG